MNNPFNPTPFGGVIPSAFTQPSPSLDSIQQQTAFNNAVAGHLRSWGRRTTEEQKFADAQSINIQAAMLSQSSISPLPTELEVCASPPINMLPKKAREFVRAVAWAFGVPVEMALVCFLGAIAVAAARRKFKVRVSELYSEVLTLFFLASASSGQRKTAVLDFFRRIIVTIENELQQTRAGDTRNASVPVWRKAVKKMEAELASRLFDLNRQHGDPEVVRALMAPEFEELERLKSQIQKETVPPRLLINLATPEKLALEMERQGGSMGIYEAEGGSLRRMLRFGEWLELFLKSFNGEVFASDTKTAGSVYLKSPVLSLCILAQQPVLDAVFRNEHFIECGLAARILPVFVPSENGPWHGAPTKIPSDLQDWFADLIRKIIRTPVLLDASGDRAFQVLELSCKACDEVDCYRGVVESQIRNGDFAQYPAFGSKLVGHAVRLAGMVHLLSHEAPESQSIEGETMACGVALAEFFRKHAAVAFSAESRDGLRCAPAILKWMRRHRPRYFNEREAHRGIGSNNGRYNISQVRAGLDVLERHSFLRGLFTSSGRIHVVNPSAYQ